MTKQSAPWSYEAATGAVVVLTVTGRNSAGESPASATVKIQVS